MYPIYPTVDLNDQHIYDLNENTIGWKEDSKITKFSNVHTFFHANNDQISDEANVARLIMFAFGYACAKSKILIKNKVIIFYNQFINFKIDLTNFF